MDTINKPYTDTDVADHEAKLGGKRNIKEVIVTDEDGVKFYYLVMRPTRIVLQAQAEAMKKGELAKQHKLSLGCVLAGDMAIIEQDGAMFSALLQSIQNIGAGVKSEIKNF